MPDYREVPAKPSEKQRQDDLRTTQIGAPREADYARPTGLQTSRGRRAKVSRPDLRSTGRR